VGNIFPFSSSFVLSLCLADTFQLASLPFKIDVRLWWGCCHELISNYPISTFQLALLATKIPKIGPMEIIPKNRPKEAKVKK